MVQLRDRIAVSVVKLIILACVIQILIRNSEGETTEPDKQEPDLPLQCYFCRSDTHRACNVEPQRYRKEFVKNCTNTTFSDFVEDLQINPPERPVVEIITMGRKSVENRADDWLCYTQFSQDQTFTLRSCTPRGTMFDVEGCNPCDQNGKPARCCTCSEDLCNDLPNGGCLISTRTLYLIGLLAFLKFLR